MLERFTNDVAHRFGIEIRRWRPFDRRRARRLADAGIDLVVDVGAGQGQYGALLREHGYHGRIVSFEPVPQSFAELRSRSAGDARWEIHNVALGAAAGSGKMHVASNLASSSFLPLLSELEETVPELAVTGSTEVSVARLDDIDVSGGPLMLKLDVQGYEDRVLDGAAETLRRAVLLECELSLAELYGDQAQLAKLLFRLDGSGFRMVDLDPFFYDPRDGRVLSIDALFETHGHVA
jgi:FkbM family methyltransferase